MKKFVNARFGHDYIQYGHFDLFMAAGRIIFCIFLLLMSIFDMKNVKAGHGDFFRDILY